MKLECSHGIQQPITAHGKIQKKFIGYRSLYVLVVWMSLHCLSKHLAILIGLDVCTFMSWRLHQFDTNYVVRTILLLKREISIQMCIRCQINVAA